MSKQGNQEAGPAAAGGGWTDSPADRREEGLRSGRLCAQVLWGSSVSEPLEAAFQVSFPPRTSGMDLRLIPYGDMWWLLCSVSDGSWSTRSYTFPTEF